MTTATEGRAPTALSVLFDQDTDAAEALASEILSAGNQNLGSALAQFPEMTRKAAVEEAAATAAAALLKVDLAGVLVRGWREHRDIVSAARRTLAAPGSAELVIVTSHQIKLDQQPSISVLVDGQRVATLQLGLSIVFDLNALLLGISGGRLTGVRSGRCDITATLAVQGTDLLNKRAHLELPGVISLRQGIRLLPVDEYPAGEDPPDEYPGSEPGAAAYTGNVQQVGEYPMEGDDPSTPWWVGTR